MSSIVVRKMFLIFINCIITVCKHRLKKNLDQFCQRNDNVRDCPQINPDDLNNSLNHVRQMTLNNLYGLNINIGIKNRITGGFKFIYFWVTFQKTNEAIQKTVFIVFLFLLKMLSFDGKKMRRSIHLFFLKLVLTLPIRNKPIKQMESSDWADDSIQIWHY